MRVDIENPRNKCYKCMRPESSCICKHTNPILTNTRFVFLMHPKEHHKEKNGTGHMAHLQLKNSEIIVDVDFTENRRVNEILNDESNASFLLYPGKENFNLSIKSQSEMNSFLGKTPYIFILDGTWPLARKMLRLSTNLQKIPRVSFDNEIQSKFIIKQQPESLCLSTIESVYTVINLLVDNKLENCSTSDFLLPFEKMLEYQVECILKPDNYNYRPQKVKKLKKMDKYKKETERNIIFEPITNSK
ncbi:DTW domain-containing protein [Flammeovirga sp. MY04]|uniref:tRNA-uridine aminocarboxypropyltransferase n=1 Tax=Flammeovirga sp. MY04 TaxID=1191459 RepID=UPI000A05E22B|nr:tRNA-uridine aminocarboxypropyltransferase [Flammeovirga sp. MY04]ANQ51993.2 DTW domain-containing protein [Flammeovirga sp. MY04]